MGLEAYQNLQAVGNGLHLQGQKIHDVKEKNDKIAQGLNKAGQIVDRISYWAFFRVAMLWLLATLLIIANMILMYLKIFR